MNVIVVGVDASKHAQRALEWAIDEARIRGARLRVIHAYQLPIGEIVHTPELYESMQEAYREAAQEVLDRALEEVRNRAPNLEVEGTVVEGAAGRALVDASSDADLVVVGSRGRGGFTGLLLGSVSQQTVQHASCPVVVIRGEG